MSNIKNKCWNFLKQNKLYVCVMIVGLLMFIAQMNYVVLYADDMVLGNIAKSGMKGAIEHLISNYMTWGGGPTPFIAIIYLLFDLSVWKISNCLMVAIIVMLSVRMITYNSKINKGIIAGIIWICIYALNIYISCETLYWLDGNLAYVLTAFQMFIYFYYLYSRLIMKTQFKKYDYILLPLVAFFAGWTGPQSGAITVIISILLILWVKIINKEKIKPIYIISIILGLAGFLVYYLAPGNNARMLESFPEFAQYNIIEKIMYRMSSVWKLMFYFIDYKFASIPCYLYFAMAFMGIISIKLSLTEKNKYVANIIKIVSIFVIIFIIANFIICINNEEIILNRIFNIKDGESIIVNLKYYAVTCAVLASMVILSYYISYKEKTPFLFLMITCAILGQVMMLLSPYSPLRSTFITVMLLWISIAYLAKMIIKHDVSIIWIASVIIAVMYNIKYSFIIIFVYLIFNSIYNMNKQKEGRLNCKCEGIVLLAILAFITLNSYLVTLNGYKVNKDIYYENIEKIQKYKESQNSGTLYLKTPDMPQYGFSTFVGTDWIEQAVIDYFELDENTIIENEK